ncbi:NEL-type E3 ubiquitin ligase domain-containing protein [Pseudomonas asplenii]|uniref:NEL-type E3 ubiquitin ligase domain-containing protein n=1 Tax=Pseudomonas asplenii TaxID=53407 RepID=UPI002234BF1F|nr:NEL-type E3 ubiquitin ligase domain-containing protein [Pseudomonas asplenii]UZE28214.1 hypothetical protein LOY63_23225 [Pseudomonas asplenii]
MSPPESHPKTIASPPPAADVDIDPQLGAFVARQHTELHSRDSWAQQQVLDHLTESFQASMSPLNEMEQRTWVGLFSSLSTTRSELDSESRQVIEAFQQAGMLKLRRRIRLLANLDLDPGTTYLHTAYAIGSRTGRALDTSRGTAVDVATLSLWEAACLNFAFFDFPEVKRRWISRSRGVADIDEPGLVDADDFIGIVRELNLGADLRTRVEQALAPDAPLSRRISAHMGDLFRFNLYDAPRNANTSGMTRALFDSLRDAGARGAPWLKVEHLSLKLPDSLLGNIARVEFAIEEAALQLFTWKPSERGRIHLPALLMRVSGVAGVYSYCAERPGGVLRHHVSQAAFEHEFKALLKVDNSRKALGWLIASLSFEHQGRLWQLLDPEHKPEGLNWAAGKLYDAFHWVFPVQTLDDLEFAYQHTGQDPQASLSAFYHWRFRVNVEAIAVPKGQQDWRAVKEGIVTVMHQLLDLLLTPVPGGLGSIGRVVMAALGVNLALELYEGLEQAGRGQPEGLLQAMLEVGNMLLMGGLHGYAGRLASRRIGNEFERLAKYRLVQSAGVGARLWKPSLLPYARKRLELATVFDDSGLGAQGGKLYGLAREQGQELTLELEYDKSLEQYRAVHPDPAQFQPPMAYDPGARLWALSLDDSHRLSDVRLLERMVTLRGGRPAQLRRVLEISGATRAHLDEIWSGGLPPPSLVEALERFKVELGLAEVAATQKEDRLLSTDTQRVLFCLVPHLGHWPEDLCLRVHNADGELQQVYGRRQQLGLFKRSVSIRQLARGGFVEQTETLLDTSTALAHEAGVLDLILGLLPGDSQPSARDPVVRRAWLKAARQQLGALAMAHSTEVFEALGIHSGRLKVDATTSASGSEVLSYLPVFVSDLPKAVVTLRSLYPHLSLSRLAHFLRDNPLSSSQARELLEYRRLPYRLRYALDREQQFSALGCVLDGIYQVRRFHEPTDAWVQCIASDFLRERLGKPLIWIEGEGAALPMSGQLLLRRYGQGIYSTLQVRRQPSVDLALPAQSFYRALAASLSDQEQGVLGMSSVTDLQPLRDGIAAYLLALREADGSLRLGLEQYERQVLPQTLAAPDSRGLYSQDGRWLIRLEQRFHEVEWDGRFDEWRGRHPTVMGAYGPLLEHNGHGGWWHEFEQPWNWDAVRALRRLAASEQAMSDGVARQILAISGVDDRLPARLLFENQPLALLLSEVMRHFSQSQGAISAEPPAELLPLVTFVRQQFPLLSSELTQDLLEGADSSELRLIRDFKRLSLTLSQEARYLSEEMQVCRLYESLCLPAARSDLNDSLLLQLLDRLPGWEQSLRIELRRDTSSGPLIASVGVDTASVHRVLVKSDEGYEPFILEKSGARSLADTQTDPFVAMLLALPQLRQTTLGISHVGETVEQDLKRVMFQSVAGERNRLRRLLGQPAVVPWTRLPQRLTRRASGALGYPLSGRASTQDYPPGLFWKLKRLYRGCTDAQLFSILAGLGSTTEARTLAVTGLQEEYRQLKRDLAIWVDAPHVHAIEMFHVDSRMTRRREVARRIRRCWRRQSVVQGPGTLSHVLVLDGLEVQDLPELHADFSHVSLLSMNSMGLGNARYLSVFLRGFTHLVTLALERNGLRSLPNGIAQMQTLQVLSLENNRLRLIQGTARELAGLEGLLELNLNGNPVGVLPDFSPLQRLQRLRLSHTGITEWPVGVLELTDLVWLELRGNTLSDLPVQLFMGHDRLCQGIDLSGNPLSSQALSSILNYRRGHEQLQIDFGLDNLPLSSVLGLDRWAVGKEKTPHRIALWQQVRDQPNADVFFLLFERMSSPLTFFNTHYRGARTDLTARVWRLLEAAAENPGLCERLFSLEAQLRYTGSTSYQIFNRLELLVGCHEALKLADQADVESRLLTLLRGQFRLEAMRLAVGILHPEQTSFWYRAYYDALAQPLGLPDHFNGLFAISPASIDRQQIGDMRARVLKQELVVQSTQSPAIDPSRVLLAQVIEPLPEEIPPEPPKVLPEQLPQEPAAVPAEDDVSPLIRFLVANELWSNFLIRAHEADFQRVFGKLLAFDSHPGDSEYRLLWRTRMNQFQYNARRTAWLRYWTIRALLKEGNPPLGNA